MRIRFEGRGLCPVVRLLRARRYPGTRQPAPRYLADAPGVHRKQPCGRSRMPQAIDIHVHAPAPPGAEDRSRSEQMAAYFRSEQTSADPEAFYQYYKDRDQLAVIFTVDARTDAAAPSPNDWV